MVIDDHIVSLEPIENKWLATALLDILPEVPAAAVWSAAVSKATEEVSPRSSSEHRLSGRTSPRRSAG